MYATKSTSTKQSYQIMFGIKKGKSRIFDQMGHRPANTSWQKGENETALYA